MKHLQRDSWRSGIFGLSKATSHDSCLDSGDEPLSGQMKTDEQCYYESRNSNSRRRATVVSITPGSLALEISKSDRSSSGSKFLSFLHKGFHGRRSKSSSKFDKDKGRSYAKCSFSEGHWHQEHITHFPIGDTVIQGNTRTLFYRDPDHSSSTKPLIMLTEATKIVMIHTSISPSQFPHCVKIISILSHVFGEESISWGANHYRVLDDVDNKERSHSCHSSQMSLFSTEQSMKPTITHLFSCDNDLEMKRWLNVLKRVARPNEQNECRKEVSLDLWILEAKNIPSKKRYFCEVYLDGELHARTTVKVMGDMLFWGEEFNMCNLDEISAMTLILCKYYEDGRSKKKRSQRKEICKIIIPMKEIGHRSIVERWYSTSSSHNAVLSETHSSHINQGILSSANTAVAAASQSVPLTNVTYSSTNATTTIGSSDHSPMIRIKARYQEIDVLPLRAYNDFIGFLNDNALRTLVEMEPFLKVKTMEDLIKNLIKIIHKKGTVVSFLCELIISEINKSDDRNLILRGNTIASKAMEIYLKLIGEKYLHLTLSDFLNRVLLEDDDCEVDPKKDCTEFHVGTSPASTDRQFLQCHLEQRQESLMMNVDMIWAKIMSSTLYFPRDLKAVFMTLRHRLRVEKQFLPMSGDQGHEPDLCDRIVSSCVFLRYICPAILTPSLFGLIAEYPDNPRVIRTFTLVAKCIQTLANFSNLSGTKETYMVFMNSFIENNFKTMRNFLREISCGPEPGDEKKNPKTAFLPTWSGNSKEHMYWESLVGSSADDTIDLALCLANLHRQMEDSLEVIRSSKQSENISNLSVILEDIKSKLRHQYGPVFSSSMKNNMPHLNVAIEPHPCYTRRPSIEFGSHKNSNVALDQITESGMYRPEFRRNSNTSGRYSTLKANKLDSTETSRETMTMSGCRRFSSAAVEQESIVLKTTTGSRRNSCDTVEPVLETGGYESRRFSCGAAEKKALLGRTKLGSRIIVSEAMKRAAILGTVRRYSGEEKETKVIVEVRRHSDDSKPQELMFQNTRFPYKVSKDPSHDEIASPLVLCDHTRDGKNTSIQTKDEPSKSRTKLKKEKSRSTNQEELEDFRPPVLVACRSTDNINKTVVARSPSSSWKPSVKSCKQSQKMVMYPTIVADDGVTSRSEETTSGSQLDSYSSQTLTDSEQSLSDTTSLDRQRLRIVDAARSMPSVHSSFDLDVDTRTSCDKSIETLRGLSGYSSGRSAFRVANNSGIGGAVTSNSMDLLLQVRPHKKGEQLPLHNLNLTQTTLDDRKTIELELKRVRYLKMICQQSSLCEGMSVQNFLLTTDQERQVAGVCVSANRSASGLSSDDEKTISVIRYLTVAENVLTVALQHVSDVSQEPVCVLAHDMADRVIEIFQINKNLQSVLRFRSENVVARMSSRDKVSSNIVTPSRPSDPNQSSYPCQTVIEFSDPL